MDKINRSHRIHQLVQFIDEALAPRVGIYFGEHVIRIDGQLCLVVTLDGDVGIRAIDPQLASEMAQLCGLRHWVAHGRVYEQWYLLPAGQALDESPVTDWIRRATEDAWRLANQDAVGAAR